MTTAKQFIFIWLLALAICTTEASAQSLTEEFLQENSLTLKTIQLIILITVLSLAPGIAIMVTCFPFIVTVLSILRQAIGLQQAPPNMLLISLALFLTYYIMEPVFKEAWTDGIDPYFQQNIAAEKALQKTSEPFVKFMSGRVDQDTLAALSELRHLDLKDHGTPPLSVLVPSFMLSEIARAFQIGFLIFLPFVIIDLVVAAILMSMGMMMVPPAMVALPFKLAFFVVADGWALIAEALVRGYL